MPQLNHHKNLKFLAKLLDSQFTIFGYKFGLDPILGLIPVAGDTISLLISTYIILAAGQLGVPRKTLLRMAINTSLDYFISIIPIIGDLTDIFYKSNLKNIQLVQQHLSHLNIKEN